MNAPLQGTPEWLAMRAGHATASCFKKVLAKVKSGEASDRRNYRTQLVTERLTGTPVESYKNAAMEWGNAMEPDARRAYEAHSGTIVDEVSFLLHPEVKWCGGSPDGCLDDDGLIEIKCPYVSTVHVETLQLGMPSEHRAQSQGLLWVTGRQWVDFVSYDPRMPEHLRLYVERVQRDDKYIEALAAEVRTFLAEVEKMHAALMDKRTLLDKLVASVDANSAAMQP